MKVIDPDVFDHHHHHPHPQGELIKREVFSLILFPSSFSNDEVQSIVRKCQRVESQLGFIHSLIDFDFPIHDSFRS